MSRSYDEYDESDDELMFVFEMSDADEEPAPRRSANPMAHQLELEDMAGSLPPPPMLQRRKTTSCLPTPTAIKRKAADEPCRPMPKRLRPAALLTAGPRQRTKNMAIPSSPPKTIASSLEYFCRHSVESSCSPLRLQFHSLFVGRATASTADATAQWLARATRDQFSF
ncbi:hypothetical protein ACHHYP_14641 [Achlya hypogyna]|uniref:Uncharacterized protein n=1 Tax=Achlya hypogyna TaxID=1202772 RepID=A0A1V9YCP0_ACHHY|nr:hypothetical protein ACHHYP_14641 [Achlya hypogyna]